MRLRLWGSFSLEGSDQDLAGHADQLAAGAVGLAGGDEHPPLALLEALQALEAQFGRQRLEHWGPRSLDLDLLWCGDVCCNSGVLDLPHPRLLERSFVLAPLAAIDPSLIPPVQAGPPAQPGKPHGIPLPSCGALLSQLLPQLQEAPPERLRPQQGWPE